MTEFRTGEKAPYAATYYFLRHIGNVSCLPTQEEKRIPLSVGETFPPCRSCQTGVIWSS